MGLKDIMGILICPRCGAELKLSNNRIACKLNKNHTYPIINNIPRFAKSLPYRYEKHWKELSSKKQNKLKLKQAEKFIDWLKKNNSINGIILDVGCGDGSHIHFVPEDILYIAIDYTSVVDLVRERYKNRENLIIIQAGASNLPFKDNSFDFVYSYSCINYLPDIRKGVFEIERIVKKSKRYALWGYGSDSKFLINLIILARKIYKVLPESLKPIMLNTIVPILTFVPNTTGINLFNSTWRECCEIVSTNLTPESLTILDTEGWNKYVNQNSIKIDEFSRDKGAIFQKSGK